MAFSVSDDFSSDDKFHFGSAPGGNFIVGTTITAEGMVWVNKHYESNEAYAVFGGRCVYFDGQRPWDAPEGSISFG